MEPQTSAEFLEKITEEGFTFEECQAFILKLDLINDLKNAKLIPKKINEDSLAIINALANFNPNNPKNTASTFNFKTYKENDNKAKVLFTNYLQNKGYTVLFKEENYGIDIEATKNNKTIKFELEISSLNFTNDGDFIYENVNFLARKEKMYKNEGDYHYIIISANGEYALTAMANQIFNVENKITKWAGNRRDGVDEFFQLPKNKIKFFNLNLNNK